jgi:phenylpropionate dioxygenase-like ring-hydroxylating dioxygenase large terminal subunit
MRVCRADAGNAAAFTCTYHGWTYGNDGKLVGVPGYKEYYYEELDMEQWGLVPVAKVDTFHGMIFGNFDATAPTLLDYLGDTAYYLEMMVDRVPGGLELIGGAHKWVMPCNWKFAADNFIGDNYHIYVTHISAMKSGLSPAPRGESARARSFQIRPKDGNGIISMLNYNPQDWWYENPEIMEYEMSIQPEMERHLGTRSKRIWPIVGTVFPNLSFEFHTMRVWHPRGPDKTEVWSWSYVDKMAPPEVKREMHLYHQRRFGPAGSFEQDDGENWNMCTASSRGRVSRRYEFNYQLMRGRERTHEEFPGMVADGPSEHPARGFYARWSQLMSP